MAEMDLIIVFTSGMNEWKPTVSLYLGEDAQSASRTALRTPVWRSFWTNWTQCMHFVGPD